MMIFVGQLRVQVDVKTEVEVKVDFDCRWLGYCVGFICKLADSLDL